MPTDRGTPADDVGGIIDRWMETVDAKVAIRVSDGLGTVICRFDLTSGAAPGRYVLSLVRLPADSN